MWYPSTLNAKTNQFLSRAGRGCWPCKQGDGGKDNHHAAGQSRYAAICQGGNQRGGRGRGDNHPGQSRRYAAARAATPPSPRGKSSGPEPPRDGSGEIIRARAAIWPGMLAL